MKDRICAKLTGLCLGLALSCGPAQAESAFGCADLMTGSQQDILEGQDGVFFRVWPELVTAHDFSDESVADLARLSVALAGGGTQLVYVPLPSRALTMPETLPPEAEALGFDPDKATSIYRDILVRLGERKIAAVDALGALASAEGGAAYYAADTRMTSAGGRRLASAIAAVLNGLAAVKDLPRNRYETRSTGKVMIPSAMRSKLQRRCAGTLPDVTTESYSTTRLGALGTGISTSLVSGDGGGRIALLSSPDAGDAGANLAGFLAEATGLDVQQYSVHGGDAFAAISTYMTSSAFRDARPSVIVWVNPVHDSLASRGDQPMRELIAAAGPECLQNLPIGLGMEPGTIIADLSGLDPLRPGVIMVDTGGAAARRVRFDFLGPAGLERSRWIERDPDQVATGRFYMPADGLWPGGASLVAITIDSAFGLNARVSACPAPAE